MQKITPSTYEPLADIGFEQTLARVGHVNAVIESLGTTFLGKLTNFNLNSTADQIVNLSGGNTFIVTDVVITNASTAVTTANTFSIHDAPSLGGNVICSQRSGSTLTTLQSPRNFVNKNTNQQSLTIANWHCLVLNNSGITVGNKLYASVQTPQGAAATADVYVYGYVLN